MDGDTIKTSAGTVRIIGIDIPEQGECGYDEASTAIGRQFSIGDDLTFDLPPIDLGMMQLQSGDALARYDSSDGYPAHPREEAYHAAQLASAGPDGSAITTSCQDEALPPVAPSAEDRWWEQYSSCTKLKKNTAELPVGPFNRDDPAQAEAYEWFAYGTGNNGDGDGDGLACEQLSSVQRWGMLWWANAPRRWGYETTRFRSESRCDGGDAARIVSSVSCIRPSVRDVTYPDPLCQNEKLLTSNSMASSIASCSALISPTTNA